MTDSKTFFFIDDDADDTFLFKEVLAEVDASLLFASASNGEEALQKLTATDARMPQLIFMDLNMPRMDGKQCLAALKANDKLKHIPVIMYTTSSYSKDKEEALQIGAAYYITKPANYNELKEILSTISQNLSNLSKAFQALSSQSA